jgi:hypothetical protein
MLFDSGVFVFGLWRLVLDSIRFWRLVFDSVRFMCSADLFEFQMPKLLSTSNGFGVQLSETIHSKAQNGFGMILV